jgi:AcrR family transcriptional regulator
MAVSWVAATQQTTRRGVKQLPSERRCQERKRIVEEASGLINARGLRNFRIDTLSERLGYSRQNLYRYYPGKQAILDAVVVEGCRAMAESMVQEQVAMDAPFDEQLIDGILMACDLLRGGATLEPYAGVNLADGVHLFMANADAVQQVLLEFLHPLFDAAKARGELYLNMSYADITRWVFQIAAYELLDAEYGARDARRTFLLAMLSPSINAKKARSNATIDNVHSSHVR